MRWAYLILLTAGCAGAGSARQALIVDTLIDADRDLIAMRPTLVAEKYQQMATEDTPQDYLRGNATIFYRDRTAVLGSDTTVHAEGSELVWIYGDAHLENIGANFDDQGMFLDCVDFDAVVQAPFDWDLRRAALGFATGLHMAGRDALVESTASVLAAGWLDGVANPTVLRSPLGAVWDPLLTSAASDLADRGELAKYTTLVDGKRQMVHDDRMVPVPEPFASDLALGIEGYRATRRAGRGDDAYWVIKDAVSRLETGVSSLPNLRFWVLVEGAPGEDDDLILEFKEERDPPEPVGLLGRGAVTPSGFSNAARVFDGTVNLLASAGSEQDLGWVTFDNVSFQVRQETLGRASLDIADFVTGATTGGWSDDDLRIAANVLGRLIGAAHLRSAPAAALLAAAGPADAFEARTGADAVADVNGLEGDFALFVAALSARGPLLGAPR